MSLQTGLIFLCAFSVSAFGTLVGFGGGVFMVPLLVLAFGVELKVAVAAVALALFPAALLSTIANARRGMVDFRLGIIFEIPTVLGAAVGARLTGILDPNLLKLLFGMLVGSLAVRLLLARPPASQPGVSSPAPFFSRVNLIRPQLSLQRPTGLYRMSLWLIVGFGLFAGTLAGMFGVGGGFLKTPIMVYAFGLPAHLAVGTSLFMITLTTLTASAVHIYDGNLQGDTAFLIVPFVAGALFGNLAKGKLPEKKLLRYIALALLAAGLAMVAAAAGGVAEG